MSWPRDASCPADLLSSVHHQRSLTPPRRAPLLDVIRSLRRLNETKEAAYYSGRLRETQPVESQWHDLAAELHMRELLTIVLVRCQSSR
jgi:hypothetical protein